MRNCKRWTETENKSIIENYGKFGTGVILSGRSKESVMMQARKLGVKRNVESKRESFNDRFGFWMSGLADGEGSFSVYYNRNDRGPKIYPQFNLGLGFSDNTKKLLEFVQKKIGGRIYIHKKYGAPQSITIKIINLKDCVFIRNMFRKYKLKIKENEFNVWSEIIDAKLDKNKNNFETLKALSMKLNPTKGIRRVFLE